MSSLRDCCVSFLDRTWVLPEIEKIESHSVATWCGLRRCLHRTTPILVTTAGPRNKMRMTWRSSLRILDKLRSRDTHGNIDAHQSIDRHIGWLD